VPVSGSNHGLSIKVASFPTCGGSVPFNALQLR
jgi:hypothetical protein